MTDLSAVVAGASGLVGAHCLDLLLGDPGVTRVACLVRSPLPVKHKKLEQFRADFDRPEEYARLVQGRAVFCCLGTTRAKAGSDEAFRRVDFQYVKDLAASARRNGAEQFLLVSSVGADSASSFLYPRVKGEAEDAVAALGFKAVHILRPSFLLGERRESRPAERLALSILRVAAPLMVGPAIGYRPIDSRRVARAMLRLARRDMVGVYVHASDRIQRLGDEFAADDL